MSIETKKVVCNPGDEERLINHHMKFGWVLAHRDEVFSQTEHINGATSYSLALTDDFSVGKTKIQTYTSTTNYVNIIFQRETTQPKYIELKKLDDDCDSLFNELTQEQEDAALRANAAKKAAGGGQRTAGIVILIIGLIMNIAGCAVGCGKTFEKSGSGVPFIVTGIIGVLIWVIGLILEFNSDISKKALAASSDILNDPTFLGQLKEIREKIAANEKAGEAILDSIKKENKPLPEPSVIEVTSKETRPVEAIEAPREEAKPLPNETQVKQLKQLKDLHDAGILTDEEYEAKRKALVDKI